jgi:hypothetical protein
MKCCAPPPSRAPVLPDRGRPAEAKASGRAAPAGEDRRGARLRARGRHACPAGARSTSQGPPVRVLVTGGRRRRARLRRREVGLTQGRELERRAYGAPHQLAERALRLAGGRWGEHVFGKLRFRSDGNAASDRRTSRTPQRFRGVEPRTGVRACKPSCRVAPNPLCAWRDFRPRSRARTRLPSWSGPSRSRRR